MKTFTINSNGFEETADMANSLPERIKESTFEDIAGLILEIAEIQSDTERAFFVGLLAKTHNIAKRAIQNDIKKIRKDDNVKTGFSILSMNFPGLVDVVADDEGNPSYLIKDGEEFRLSKSHDIDTTTFSPPSKEDIPFSLVRGEDIIECYKKEDKGLFNDLLVYLKRFSFLEFKQWLIVACFVFLTYLQDFPDIHYMPMLLFYAVPERGKSRTGKSIIYVAFRGVHLVDLREANIFRYSENLRATLFFDMMDLWTKAVKNGAEDILLGRYEKGAKAARVIYPEKGAFQDMVHYDIYGPTIIATNQNIHKILDTRCLNTSMPNKPGEYENPTQEKGLPLKARLIAWRARVMDKSLPIVKHIPELTGRLWDITQPLLQVCSMVYPEGFDELKEAFIEIARQRVEDRKESIDGKIVSILEELSPTDKATWIIKVADIEEKLNENRAEKDKFSSQYIGGKLKALGFNKRKVNGRSQIILVRRDFDTLLKGYNNISSDMYAEPLPLSTSCTEPENTPCSIGSDSGSDLVDTGNYLSLSTNSLPANTGVNTTSLRPVDSSIECGQSSDDNILSLETDCEVEF
ncbi:hypothetical protein [Candidatus Magnetominusculus xianensis]|uniref:DUF3631 domain-containing protein n=1 Tax=Candidatus Magnetominusculus xianensis TaxID=1748249 RepID=A0ABR5SI72_9BACT|nr:hypothetical protein [Candidatus Magnetominusculus xianensis]KWT92038.1 hypothetical protein ASN18_0591 [Candidatus Magnetominusculus xianensis]MBF0404618.1 hypothetical protein [Nitrospirota bacterium]